MYINKKYCHVLWYCTVHNSSEVKLGRIDCFIGLAREMLANLQWLTLATLVNLEFG